MDASQKNIVIDGKSLNASDVIAISRRDARVSLCPAARAALQSTRDFVESNWLAEDAPPVYALNTGVGSRKNIKLSPSAIPRFQKNLIMATSAGTGEPMPLEVVRAMMVLRANVFATNYSGIRVEVVERLLQMLNHGIIPIIPAKGSVGASGDLAPLAFLGAALMGHSDSLVYFGPRILPADKAFAEAGLPPTIDVQAKDATALLNGSTASLAYAVVAAYDARVLLRSAVASLCLSLEALRCEVSCFDDTMMSARPHKGQRAVATAIREMVLKSERCTDAAREVRISSGPKPIGQGTSERHAPPLGPRINDAYSLRCAPQVYGPVLEALNYIDGILGVEINSSTDNPLFIKTDDNSYRAISGGHFHGQYVAQAMDLLAIAVTDLGAICDRRAARLVDPACSFGLPGGLIAIEPGINNGFGGAQSMGTGLTLENMGLCAPASTLSLPAKANSEDHISNSCYSARRVRTIVENTQAIVAVELLLASQALDLVAPEFLEFPIGEGTLHAWQEVRRFAPPTLKDDRWVFGDIEALRLAISTEAIAASVSNWIKDF
ncbi:HAL/PAL/TAL family ammonia-lyase [Caballeronia sordidicola]|uniref:Histidine ammonia-lyase n=1 Tax=Caballeronia sordidicola TaxID=196367 RepID=A0A2C9XXA9_CABSO|nr:aromatic amino acid ammonia-lyase [Caballeronia sordidicola]OTP74097.1 Histidine ammonia-lyase [Caballeronia sordidicola]